MVQDNGRGVVAFYDIDTPVTLAQLEKGECDYLSPERIPGYDYYFSFSGGPVPSIIEQTYGAPVAAPLYCSVDADRYAPTGARLRWDLGYLGTYRSEEHTSELQSLMRISYAVFCLTK